MHARQGQIKLWFTRLCYFQAFSDIFSLADPLCAIITLLSGIRTVIRRLEIAVAFMISTVQYFSPKMEFVYRVIQIGGQKLSYV